jgi:hypothetical protein
MLSDDVHGSYLAQQRGFGVDIDSPIGKPALSKNASSRTRLLKPVANCVRFILQSTSGGSFALCLRRESMAHFFRCLKFAEETTCLIYFSDSRVRAANHDQSSLGLVVVLDVGGILGSI